MKKAAKRMVRGLVRKLGYDIVYVNRSPDLYFGKKRDLVFHESLEEARNTIFEETPSEQYRESYHMHQIGAWGPIPAVIYADSVRRSGTAPRSLDIGCAFGTMAAFCSRLGYSASATDFVSEEVFLGEKTRSRYGIVFSKVEIEKEPLPFKEKEFDLVTMTEVLEHFQFQPMDVLAKVRYVVKDEGLLLITTPALGVHWKQEYYACPFEDILTYAGQKTNEDRHWKIYDAAELKRLLERSGFRAFIGQYISANTGLEGLYAVAKKA
jgi:2-polyprenyl-3-methyl-5-hydroxy-6-metoxy-1,4-benzoquinol methylase